MKKGKKGDKEKGKNKDVQLTPEQRSILANRIRMQLYTIETDGHLLEHMDGIKKLKIMLSLFEQAGKEFETFVALSGLDDRYLEIRLRTNKNRPSVVIIRHGQMPLPTISNEDHKNHAILEENATLEENGNDDEEVLDLVSQ